MYLVGLTYSVILLRLSFKYFGLDSSLNKENVVLKSPLIIVPGLTCIFMYLICGTECIDISCIFVNNHYLSLHHNGLFTLYSCEMK